MEIFEHLNDVERQSLREREAAVAQAQATLGRLATAKAEAEQRLRHARSQHAAYRSRAVAAAIGGQAAAAPKPEDTVENCELLVSDLAAKLAEQQEAIEDAKRELLKRERELLRVCIDRAAEGYAAAAAQLAAHWQQLNAAQLALGERQLHWPQIYIPALRGMEGSWECHGRPTLFDGNAKAHS